MIYDHILVRYGELTLKGGNRKTFVSQLRSNVKRALMPLKGYEVKANRDRMYIQLEPEADIEEMMTRISKVFGVHSISPVLKLEKSMDAVYEHARLFAQNYEAGDSFKIEVKRSDKKFEYETFAIQRMVGGEVLKSNTSLHVDVRQPDHEIKVEVRLDAIYMYDRIIPAIGGLPVGTGGKTLLMLSGGIDSPVAGMEVMRRGVTIEAIHFHSPPFTSEKAKEKVIELTRIMAERVGSIRLHIVPFTEVQKQIHKVVHERYTMTSTRRMMLRIADKVVYQIGADAIVNGENLGQVASQTLKSMYAINAVTNTPILRPLLSLDKEEIVQKAKDIGTFETSIQPYEDCCTIFTPKNPVTEPQFEKVLQYESGFDFEEMIDRAVGNIETIVIDKNYQTHQDEQNTWDDDLF
ncbi:tRNA 4-thiouridine(8) synthase ThiI [Staphylococcus pseudintermedius]|uniref:Probable tRNA sulfurtransferase n=1 Tax=Staphylococcus pseudintermedius TaxID=283734 RepID=A0A7T7SX47_STAPS|nr:tRNA uracil 4-sulfurtransferase ThiI [Staphylococcus pseudintermedius]ADX76357.1 thiamine biosynthesis/tRNA modification protein ThiI [Staphylococcus pseudintermedius ED99]EGQ0291148.1 tRNA 4-thiouridine(8) synthase ThiI [Staphylococcus pseudintermedius]EGQ0311468.1 tRNA 4-thiouridine(8) synthase ThiI [Staphylococcus pseudintermedius]EGQ0325031.1 tRNA 4-thiouridine(8) synthase ThiI [Staphylococcus pseudintermedius]EGQ0361152.1 tRNA 4-thiouridine(8) synthase ThiI [Staphylococcus pseudinterme